MRADLALVFIALIWGSTFVLVKRALTDVTPLLYLAIRFSLASIALLICFRGRANLGFGRQEWRAGFFTGLFLMLGYVLQTVGLQSTTPSKSAFLTGLYIVLVPFAASLVYRIKPHLMEVAGAVVAGLGMALLSVQKESLSIAKGDLFSIGCAVAFAVHIVLLGHWAPLVGFESLSLLQIICAAAIAIVATPLAETPSITWTPAVVGAIAIGGFLATAVAFVLQTWAQQRTSPTRAAALFSLEPVFAWVISWLVEGEQLTHRAIAGAVLILGGILLVELKPAQASVHP